MMMLGWVGIEHWNYKLKRTRRACLISSVDQIHEFTAMAYDLFLIE